jgi:hypothetical protein
MTSGPKAGHARSRGGMAATREWSTPESPTRQAAGEVRRGRVASVRWGSRGEAGGTRAVEARGEAAPCGGDARGCGARAVLRRADEKTTRR